MHGCASAIFAAIHTHSRTGGCVSGKIERPEMSPALRLVSTILDEDLEEDMMEQERHPASGGSGGGTTSDDLLRRVQVLEEGQKAIMNKLDGISDGIKDSRLDNERRYGTIEGRLNGIEKMLDAKSNKSDLTPIETKLTAINAAIDTRAPVADLSLLRGKVDGLPTTLQLIGFATTVFVAAGISRYFLH